MYVMKLNRKKRRALKAKGVKMARTEQQIREEYSALCVRAGEMQYQVSQLEKAISDINVRLVELNSEFAELKKSTPSETNQSGGQDDSSQNQESQTGSNP